MSYPDVKVQTNARLAARIDYLEKRLQLIRSVAGNPVAAEACRLIIAEVNLALEY